MANGFRAGLVYGHIPVVLSQLLELAGKPPAHEGVVGGDLDSLDPEPTVMRRHLQARPGRRNEIVASPVYDALPVLVSEQGELRGRTYRQGPLFRHRRTVPFA